MGCLVERYRRELEESMPEVTAWFGVNRPGEIISHLGLLYHAGADRRACHHRTAPLCLPEDFRGMRPHLRLLCHTRHTGDGIFQHLLEELVAEARFLASEGVKELILIAQDLTLYGTDIYGRQMLPELVRQLSAIEDLGWIRLHYLYPCGISRMRSLR